MPSIHITVKKDNVRVETEIWGGREEIQGNKKLTKSYTSKL